MVDMACGHGLLAYLMILLDDTSPTALAVDLKVPKSAAKVGEAMAREWPRLAGRVRVEAGPLGAVELSREDVVVSAHACGRLTDEVLSRAVSASARVAVLPCCQDEAQGDDGGVGGWLDAPLAIDVTRAARLRAAGYSVFTQRIPAAITEKNRLLLGAPAACERDPAAER